MSDSTSSPTDSSQDIDAFYGNQMSEAECKRFLREQGSGVLSLAREGTAYGIPVSFGFDGEERLYFLLAGYHEPSRKKEFARTTDRASFLTYQGSSRENWRSVIVEGTLEEVSSEDLKHAREHIEDNAWFPDLFSKADPRGDVEVWCLRADSLSGLQSEG